VLQHFSVSEFDSLSGTAENHFEKDPSGQILFKIEDINTRGRFFPPFGRERVHHVNRWERHGIKGGAVQFEAAGGCGPSEVGRNLQCQTVRGVNTR
jgi:hypothetical protein